MNNPSEMPGPEPTGKIDLWMDNWAWAPSADMDEPADPDGPDQVPAGLHRLGRLLAELKAECARLREEGEVLRSRMSVLERQISALENSQNALAQPKRKNGW